MNLRYQIYLVIILYTLLFCDILWLWKPKAEPITVIPVCLKQIITSEPIQSKNFGYQLIQKQHGWKNVCVYPIE